MPDVLELAAGVPARPSQSWHRRGRLVPGAGRRVRAAGGAQQPGQEAELGVPGTGSLVPPGGDGPASFADSPGTTPAATQLPGLRSLRAASHGS